ncbi:DUF975 family protein [Lacticaseibacillus pantheris]|uniref:Integral membrane protein n=2 Tax=Lacticaseibacillus pantheris TaxID=171523 RepID=A0A0R1U3X6_9LACO|nr:DUF975 family protein [Lacticaseibacillus pantheris]KRL87985.1 hypothetical protein FC50_GL000969 [Lacticaseibacillus pantheris DSM 15945 = JCM 12539 = NBRC 106106]WKF85522.1 DUF975 family protein [Lacticaseibacillus pantheris]
MNDDLFMTRAEMKARAKDRLNHPGVRLKLALALILPVVIMLILNIVVGMGLKQVMDQVTSLSDADFINRVQQATMDTQKKSLFANLLTFYFFTGVSLTTLDVVRNPDRPLRVFDIMFKLFNSTYFFSMLIMYVLVTLIVGVGSAFFYVPGIIFGLGLRLVYFLLYDARQRGDNRGAFTIMGDSWRLMRGYKADLLVMYLSFIPWYLLSALTLGLAELYVTPYIQATIAVFYEQVRIRYAADNPDSDAADGPREGQNHMDD